MLDTLDFTLRYQRVRGAQYHVRPLTLVQQEMMYRCDGRVTVADLADATRHSHPEIRAALRFLLAHGLVKTLPPDPWLFAPIPHQQAPRPLAHAPGPIRRFLQWLPRLRLIFQI